MNSATVLTWVLNFCAESSGSPHPDTADSIGETVPEL